MDLLELQQRANIIVNKVNEYEASLVGQEVNENDILNEHTYVDIHSLRPAMKLLFGTTVNDKLSRTLFNDIPYRFYSMMPPVGNSYVEIDMADIDVDKYVINDNYWNVNDEFYNWFNNQTGILDSDNSYITLGMWTNPSLVFNNTLEFTYLMRYDVDPRERNDCYFSGGRTSFIHLGSSSEEQPNYMLYQFGKSYDEVALFQYTLNEPFKVTIKLIKAEDWQETELFTVEIYINDDLKYTGTLDIKFLEDLQLGVPCNAATLAYILEPAINVSRLYYDLTKTYIKIDDIKIDTIIWKATSSEFTHQTHNQLNNLDMWNNYNMTQMDAQVNFYNESGTIQRDGLKYVQSSNIQDALVTESQVANVFKWNTTHTSTAIPNNRFTNVRQVPGIVLYYLGNEYSGVYTATVPFTSVGGNLNNVNYSRPTMYGAYYQQYNPEESQVGEDMGHEACRLFVPGCNYIDGRLISPQQIWQPARKFGEENVPFGYNWQGQALYHELVYKDKRSDISDDLDFVPCIDAVADNDPQGLATRFALAQQKEYYYNRPFFNELTELGDTTGTKAKQIAENIIEASKTTKNTYTLADFLTEHGEVSVDKGIASNFSTNNYLTVTNNSTYKNLNTYIVKFTTSDIINTKQRILHAENFMNLEIAENSNLTAYSWSTQATTNLLELDTDTTYVIKIVIVDNQTKKYYNVTDSGETELATITDSAMDFNNVNYSFVIGTGSINSHANPFTGTIDLPSSSIQLKDSEEAVSLCEVDEVIVDMTDTEFYNNYKLDYKTYHKTGEDDSDI